jgi:hypothetical protein
MNIINDVLARCLYYIDPDFGFTSQGRKIRNNANNKRYGWNPHLTKCKKIVSDFIRSDTKNKRLSILGAGSLLDIPIEVFNSHYKVIYLQDANPSCLSEWSKFTQTQRLKPRIEPCLLDINGDISVWSKMCHDQIKHKSLSGALSFLKNLPETNIKKPAFINAESCISLNILSQLPVYWQDFIFRILSRKFGARVIKNNEEEILLALRKTSNLIIKNHLDDILPKKKNHSTLLLTDLKYFYLKKNVSLSLDNNESREKKISDYSLQVKSETKTVEVKEQDALFDVVLEAYIEQRLKSRGFTYTIIDSWIWEIRKEARTNTNHQVIAIAFNSID